MFIRIIIYISLPIICFCQSPNNINFKNNIYENSVKESNINRDFYLEVIKIRWKKLALESCTPCPTSPACTVGLASSSSMTITVNTIMTNIIHTTTSATGIGTATGLPAGVTAAWASNTITISGTPTTTGTFNYTIPLTGTGCIGVNATGTITVTAPASSCPTSTITDIDGNTYNTVPIGAQCWMKENLRLSHYRNGDPIPVVTDNTAWSNLTSGARSWYDNDSTSYEASYGNLYNWYAGSDTRGICPVGWHVPSQTDAQNLINFLGGFTVAGGKLKEVGTTYWYDTFNGNVGATNESGFSARGGGTRNSGGNFSVLRQIGLFWTTSENYEFDCVNNGIGAGLSNVSFKTIGYSIRCIKD